MKNLFLFSLLAALFLVGCTSKPEVKIAKKLCSCMDGAADARADLISYTMSNYKKLMDEEDKQMDKYKDKYEKFEEELEEGSEKFAKWLEKNPKYMGYMAHASYESLSGYLLKFCPEVVGLAGMGSMYGELDDDFLDDLDDLEDALYEARD